MTTEEYLKQNKELNQDISINNVMSRFDMTNRVKMLHKHVPSVFPSKPITILPTEVGTTEPEVAPPSIGVNASYIGFGGSTGAINDQHWIHNFQFTSAVPNQSISFANLIGGSTFVNNATVLNGSIRLTNSIGGQSGNVFLNTPVTLILNSGIPIDWSAYFEFSIGGGGGADGLSFILQSNTLNVGGIGGGIGYSGIPRSVAIGFDTWYNSDQSDPNAGHIEIDVNGSVNSVAKTTTTLPFSLRGTTGTSDRRYSWIDYTNQVFHIYYSDTNVKPSSPILTHTLNIANYIVV